MKVTSRHLSVLSLRRDGTGAPRASLLTYLPIVLLLVLRLAAPSTAGLAYAGLAAYALLGRRQAIYALTLSWLFTMVNPGIAPESAGAGAGAGRYVVMLAAASSALLRSGFLTRHLRVRPFTVATVLLSGFFVLHSVLVSPLPDVSILKALSWGLTMTALLSLWLGLSPSELDAWRKGRAGMEVKALLHLVGAGRKRSRRWRARSSHDDHPFAVRCA